MKHRGNEHQRILLTRSSEDNREWTGPMTREGFVAVDMPCIHCETLKDSGKQLSLGLERAQALLFTSARAVQTLVELCPDFDLGSVVTACVGDATAAALDSAGAKCTFMPAEGTGRALAEQWIEQMPAELNVLWPTALEARKDMIEVFREAQRPLNSVAIYGTHPAQNINRQLLGEAHGIFFASPSAVSALLALGPLPTSLAVISIGPSTTQALREHAVPVAAEAHTRGLAGLLQAWRMLPMNNPPLHH